MKLLRKHSSTSNCLTAKLRSSSTGQGLTGLTSSSSGLILSVRADNEASPTVYSVASSNVESITTLGTFAAPTSGKIRFKELDATNAKGEYEFQIADSRFSVSGAKSLKLEWTGASGLLDGGVTIQLTKMDLDDAVRGGMTAMPNANAGASGGLALVGSQIPNANAGAIGGLGVLDADGFLLSFDEHSEIGSLLLPAITADLDGRDLATAAGQTGILNAITAVPAAVWNALTSTMTTAGSIGKKLADWVIGTLTTTERTAIANEVEAQIIDETDSEKVLTAITDKIASVNPSLGDLTLAAIASANRTEMDANSMRLAAIATDASTAATQAAAAATSAASADTKATAIQAKTDNHPGNLKNWLGAIAGKTADTATRAEINATTAGAGYNETTDSQEAIRDRGDVAWTTGAGGTGSAPTAAENAAAVVAALARTVAVTVVGIVNGQVIECVRADDYSADTSRLWTFEKVAGEPWPDDLTDHTVTFTATKASGNTNEGDATLTLSGAVVTATGADQTVTLSPTSAQLASLAIGVGAKGYNWDLVAVKDAKKKTLRRGVMTVRQNQTA